jgi:hypothetical protein
MRTPARITTVVGLWLSLAPTLSFAAPPEPAPEPAPAAAAPGPAPASADSGQLVTDGPVAVRASVSPDPSNIGDLLTLQIVAAYPRGYAVNLPTTLDLEPLHLVGVEEGEPESTGQGLRKTFRVQLQSFSVGEQRVPSFPVTYVDAIGAVQTIDLPSVPFTAQSLLANEDAPARKGEDPPVSIDYPNDLAETVAWSAAGTLLVGLLAWLLARRWFRREKVVVAPPPIPPHEVAYAALEELRKGELLGSERYADYYVQLTEITKAYLQGSFGVHALDRTTEEIRRELVRAPGVVAPLSGDEVVKLLQRYDLVKFARFAPPREEAEEDLEAVRTIVDRSKPVAGPKAKPASPGSAKAAADEDPAAADGAQADDARADDEEEEARS